MKHLYNLQKEINLIIDEYNDICYNLSIYDGSIDRVRLLESREKTLNILRKKLKDKENELNKISDNDLRMILRLKLRGYKWREISNEINYSIRTCKAKYYKYKEGILRYDKSSKAKSTKTSKKSIKQDEHSIKRPK